MEKRDLATPKIEQNLSPREIAEAIRTGQIPTDSAIDRYLPARFRFVSHQYWTPVAVALRVSQWLTEVGAKTVLDVGSGPGKFCVLGALSTHCSFVGIEQRERLFLAAHQLARCFEVNERVRLVHGVFGEVPLENFDAYYFYNPFIENVFPSEEWLDDSVEHSEEKFNREVALVGKLMRNSPIGTYIICYNGFGGSISHDYELVRNDPSSFDSLRMWKKVHSSRTTPLHTETAHR
jgi:SAM-dependent methyltransferase